METNDPSGDSKESPLDSSSSSLPLSRWLVEGPQVTLERNFQRKNRRFQGTLEKTHKDFNLNLRRREQEEEDTGLPRGDEGEGD